MRDHFPKQGGLKASERGTHPVWSGVLVCGWGLSLCLRQGRVLSLGAPQARLPGLALLPQPLSRIGPPPAGPDLVLG